MKKWDQWLPTGPCIVPQRLEAICRGSIKFTIDDIQPTDRGSIHAPSGCLSRRGRRDKITKWTVLGDTVHREQIESQFFILVETNLIGFAIWEELLKLIQ